jgi:hypothetical protein
MRYEMSCSLFVIHEILVPVIKGEPDMVGLVETDMVGSRDFLCLFGRISRTLVIFNALSELGLPGESMSYQIQGESVDWWSDIILSSHKTGGVFRRARRVTSTSCHSGTRHVKSWSLTGTVSRGETLHVVAV